jgi:hypothetical protein
MMYHDQNKHIRSYFLSLYKRCDVQRRHELKLRSLEAHRRSAISQYNFPKIIKFLEIIHRPVFCLIDVSETGFCLRPQMKAYSVGLNRKG